MLVTTYQHDYVPPYTRRYEFIKKMNVGLGEEDKSKDEPPCECIDPEAVKPPTSANKECDTLEWSGIAPMGRLVNPKIIPAKLTPEQLEKMATDSGVDCFKEQPNRFLKVLSSLYPDLYDRLKNMPKEDVASNLDKERLHTTYQIDYCHMNEYPEGVYSSLKSAQDANQINDSKLLHPVDPCAEFKAALEQYLNEEGNLGMRPDACEKAYKPMKMSFGDSNRFVDSGNNSHWRGSSFKKHATITEYMDVISRNGCVIMKNRIHDHSKCTKNHCAHTLKNKCLHIEKE